MNERGRFLNLAEAHFREAVRRGVPPFLTSVGQSTPINATPYVVHLQNFLEESRTWPGRAHLITALEGIVAEGANLGVVVEAILVGGSFVDLQNQNPNDIDCLALYRLMVEYSSTVVNSIKNLQIHAKASRVDIRFAPIDSDPILLLKAVSFFSILYSKDRQSNIFARGLLLVDCRVRLIDDE